MNRLVNLADSGIGGMEPGGSDEFDIRGALGLLRRQFKLIAVTVFLVLAVAGAAIVVMKPLYTATALILVDPSRKNLLDPDMQVQSGSSDGARVESEVELVKSETTLLRAIDDLDLITDTEFGVRLGFRDILLSFLRIGQPTLPTGDAALQDVLSNVRDATTVQRRGLHDVDVTGQYRKPGLYIQGYTEMSGLDFSEGGNSVDVTSGWGKPVIIDPMADLLPTGTPGTPGNAGSFFDASAADGSYSLVGLEVTAPAGHFNELDGTTAADAIIPGNPSWDGNSPLNDYFEANHPGYSGSNGITVGADDVSISGLQFSGFVNAIQLGTSEGASVTGNHFVNNVRGINKDGAAEVTDVTISDNVFENGVHGITISAGRVGDTGVGSFDGVTMDGNSFRALSEKGMYFEQLSNAAISGSTFDDVGNYGRVSPPFGGTDGAFGQALELNLKYQAYSDIEFTDTTITNSGHSNKDGAGSTGTGAAAVGVKVRDDGDDYGTLKASVTDTVKFDGLTIDGTSTGVRVGEPNKGNDGPDVELTDYKVSNATVGDIDNATDADPALGGTVEVTLEESEGNLDADQSQANLVVNGNALENIVSTGSGDDRFEGFGGDDTFNGGAGIDTLVLNGDIDDYAVNLGDGTVADE